jgi:hypothetical protein
MSTRSSKTAGEGLLRGDVPGDPVPALLVDPAQAEASSTAMHVSSRRSNAHLPGGVAAFLLLTGQARHRRGDSPG